MEMKVEYSVFIKVGRFIQVLNGTHNISRLDTKKILGLTVSCWVCSCALWIDYYT